MISHAKIFRHRHMFKTLTGLARRASRRFFRPSRRTGRQIWAVGTLGALSLGPGWRPQGGPQTDSYSS